MSHVTDTSGELLNEKGNIAGSYSSGENGNIKRLNSREAGGS